MGERAPTTSDRTFLVTGANAGIGRATALGLAHAGATVVMVARDPVRGQRAADEIRCQTGNESVGLLIADLSSQAAIRRLATEFEARYPALHVLVNNAGVIPPRRSLTEDGLETQFAVNHLSYFLLTNLLRERLERGAPARVVNVASQAHRRVAIEFGDLQSCRSYHPRRVYSRTKLANVLFTYELARRLEGSGVTANCLHPGVIATRLWGEYAGMPGPLRFLTDLLGASPEKGARTSLHLALSPEVGNVTGKYFIDRKVRPSSLASQNRADAARLWQVSAELCGLEAG